MQEERGKEGKEGIDEYRCDITRKILWGIFDKGN